MKKNKRSGYFILLLSSIFVLFIASKIFAQASPANPPGGEKMPGTTTDKIRFGRGIIDTTDTYSGVAATDGVIHTAVIDSVTAINDTPEFFEDTSFIPSESPVTLDINTALGRNATRGFVVNDGANNVTISFSTDGAVFGDAITLKAGETYLYEKQIVDSITITNVDTTSYRAVGQ